MSLVTRLSNRERKTAYRTWLDHIETEQRVSSNGKIVYTNFDFITKSGKSLTVTVMHTKAVKPEQLDYKIYRQAYRALHDPLNDSVFMCLLFITKKAHCIYAT